MKLHLAEARKCIDLLDSLDMYVLEHCNVIKRSKRMCSNLHAVRLKLRLYWQENSHIIEDFLAQQKVMSEDDIQTIRAWKKSSRESYIISRHYEEYSTFIPVGQNKVFGVLALTEDFFEVLPQEPPVLVETSLLPYKGQIVWDGLVALSPLVFGSNYTASFIEISDGARKKGKVITSL